VERKAPGARSLLLPLVPSAIGFILLKSSRSCTETGTLVTGLLEHFVSGAIRIDGGLPNEIGRADLLSPSQWDIEPSQMLGCCFDLMKKYCADITC
jgi:hypothetical protein